MSGAFYEDARQEGLILSLGQVACGLTAHSEWLSKTGCPFCRAVI